MNEENLIGEKLCLNGILFRLSNIEIYLLVYYFRAVDNPGEKGGSFDSSGAFHDNHYEEEHRYNMGNEQSHDVR